MCSFNIALVRKLEREGERETETQRQRDRDTEGGGRERINECLIYEGNV